MKLPLGMLSPLFLAGAVIAGCADSAIDPDGAEDGRDDTFLAGGKADAGGIAEGSADWRAIALALPVLVGKLAVGGAALAAIEVFSAKMRIFRAPEFLGTAFLLAVLGMLVNQLLGA